MTTAAFARAIKAGLARLTARDQLASAEAVERQALAELTSVERLEYRPALSVAYEEERLASRP